MTHVNKKPSIKKIELELFEYSFFIQKTISDLKKANLPLDKKYYKIPTVSWFKHKKWYHVMHENIVQEKRNWNSFLYAYLHQLEQEKFFKKMTKRINAINKNEDKYLFEHYVERLLRLCFYEEDTGFFKLKNLIQYLLDSIENKRPIVQTHSFLIGIMIDENEIKINKNLKIRKATKKDFEIPISTEDWNNYEHVVESSFCILEYTYCKESIHDYSFIVLEKIEKILQLFKLSSTKCTGILEKSSDFQDHIYGIHQRGFHHSQRLEYYAKITQRDIKYLKNFYNLMNEKPRSFFNYYRETNSLEIALSRYMKGLELVHHTNTSISYAVITMEALLIKTEGDQKLRFSLRVSKILELIGLDPKEVYENMQTAYDVRSKYVHGDKMSRKTANIIKNRFRHEEEFGFLMMDYARLIIVIYIILNKSKDDLIKMLEESQFKNGEKQLKDELKIIMKYQNLKNYAPEFDIWSLGENYYITK